MYDHVLISEYCNMGGEGFSHISNETGHPENFLHIGKVVIEDFAEIFPYTKKRGVRVGDVTP